MKNKILLPVVLAILVLMSAPAYAQEDPMANFMDSVGYTADSVIDSVRLFLTFDGKAKAGLNLDIADKKIGCSTEARLLP
ncbi:MAG: hypothetical protein HY365_03955 [Candidatus Aenigmarchaeota archaeon]|nr:hypothetical protein [Candidatus Aenigmarchaeota archaeon]